MKNCKNTVQIVKTALIVSMLQKRKDELLRGLNK